LKIKVTGRHFDITEVIVAESQAVLNTRTEQDFQDAFKKMAEALGMVHTTSRVMVASRPKLYF
jgi:predicted helicase